MVTNIEEPVGLDDVVLHCVSGDVEWIITKLDTCIQLSEMQSVRIPGAGPFKMLTQTHVDMDWPLSVLIDASDNRETVVIKVGNLSAIRLTREEAQKLAPLASG